jgi:hypothetical protein
MKNIKNFEHYYIDEQGNVYSKKRGNIKKLSPILTHYGYYDVGLTNSKGICKMYIHRLVAEHYIDNPNNLPQVNHIDGNKLNNNVFNLEWCNSKDNLKHARETGLNNSIPRPNGKGEKNSRSKLTDNLVLEIRQKASEGITHKELSMHYKVAESTISGIISRIRWKHI